MILADFERMVTIIEKYEAKMNARMDVLLEELRACQETTEVRAAYCTILCVVFSCV
jgi:hypothetical protein